MLGGMSRRSALQFAFVAAFWGASYLFIKVALEDVFSPPMIVFVRTALAALVLAPLAWRTGRAGALRGALGVVALLAVMQVVVPFMLISYGEDHISSSLAGILVSTAPIYAFLLAVVITPEERAKRIGGVGVGVGIAGVVLLLGVDAGGGSAALLGGSMVALASLGYAAGAFLIKRRLADQAPIVLVTATMAVSAVLSLPLAATALPASAPVAGGGRVPDRAGGAGHRRRVRLLLRPDRHARAAEGVAGGLHRAGVRRALRRRAAGRGRGRGHLRRARADPAGLVPGGLRAAAVRQACTAS